MTSASKVRNQLKLAADSQQNAAAPRGSLYLYALGVAMFAAPDGGEGRLVEVFGELAAAEGVDGNKVLTFLAMADD